MTIIFVGKCTPASLSRCRITSPSPDERTASRIATSGCSSVIAFHVSSPFPVIAVTRNSPVSSTSDFSISRKSSLGSASSTVFRLSIGQKTPFRACAVPKGVAREPCCCKKTLLLQENLAVARKPCLLQGNLACCKGTLLF